MQEHLFWQFYSGGCGGFLEDVSVTLINRQMPLILRKEKITG